jgi:hypothetical protein
MQFGEPDDHGERNRGTDSSEAFQADAWEIRRADPPDQFSADGSGQTRNRSDGSVLRDEHLGVAGANRAGIDFSRVLGGIISQLIASAERRLGSAEQGLIWHEQEKQQALQDLEFLRNLEQFTQTNK